MIRKPKFLIPGVDKKLLVKDATKLPLKINVGVGPVIRGASSARGSSELGASKSIKTRSGPSAF